MSEKESLIDNEVAMSGAPQGKGKYLEASVEDKAVEIKATQLEGNFEDEAVDEGDRSRMESPEEPRGTSLATSYHSTGCHYILVCIFNM